MRIPALFMTLMLALAAHAGGVTLKETAPDRHTVVKGDTLWDISARFLNDPWKWPEVWQLNREEIRNPHLIYPGDIIHLIRGDQPRLVLEQGMRTVRLSPQVRAEALELADTGIPSIPYKVIAPFMSRGGITAPGGLGDAPAILGSSDDRVLFGVHDQVYAGAGDPSVDKWQIVREGAALRDPVSGEVLGHELVHVGEARTVKPGAPQLVRITHASQEVLEQDRLTPLFEDTELHFAPRAPDQAVDARVLAVLGGVDGAGTYSTVVLNKGRADGLEAGHVLGLLRAGRSIADPKCIRARKLAFMSAGLDGSTDCQPNPEDDAALPDRRIGLLFVYRVFDRAAYALVTASEVPVYIMDAARNP
jgi:hypothetical protein